MANIRVINKLAPVSKYLGKLSSRFENQPKGWQLRARGKLANIHAAGAKVRVTRKMQGYLGAQLGVVPPRVGKLLIIPARPPSATFKMARGVAKDVAIHVVTGRPAQIKKTMVEGVLLQFDRGFAPPSRDWGDFKAARPTLGGRRGRVAKGWIQGTFRKIS